MKVYGSVLCIATVWLGMASARAQSASPSQDAQNAIGEAKYQIGVLSERVMSCAVQVGRDNQEVSRLKAELAAAKTEIEKMKPKAAPTPAPDNPPEAPK